jgi:hypothetical protein
MFKRWTEMPRGGHFAALEEPELLVHDIRRFFVRCEKMGSDEPSEGEAERRRVEVQGFVHAPSR